MRAAASLATLGPHLKIVETPHMTETRMLVLSRWGRFRAWIEDLASRAELHYPFPKVRRSETIPSAKVLVVGSRLYCHPETARRIRALAARAEG